MSKPRNVSKAMGLITIFSTTLGQHMETSADEDSILQLPEEEKIRITREYVASLSRAAYYHALLRGRCFLAAQTYPAQSAGLLARMQAAGMVETRVPIGARMEVPEVEVEIVRFALSYDSGEVAGLITIPSLSGHKFRKAEGREAVWFLSELWPYREFIRDLLRVYVEGGEQKYYLDLNKDKFEFANKDMPERFRQRFERHLFVEVR